MVQPAGIYTCFINNYVVLDSVCVRVPVPVPVFLLLMEHLIAVPFLWIWFDAIR